MPTRDPAMCALPSRYAGDMRRCGGGGGGDASNVRGSLATQPCGSCGRRSMAHQRLLAWQDSSQGPATVPRPGILRAMPCRARLQWRLLAS
ncbi:hypothetical protein CHLRE_16g690508v5 [Chlamydomonas reinhardtii]|uniref:Uncharacterized protein n=1 Tax=Chlamydomonas reinhardtii TaxID=3055 RepID=A0A2K3CU88_CHLRE|nr:uncharacterized protein CHLRE_16g690508v5 [Chlamydomonas reinhardtii]PNW71844.1 hypothetical protein CHLRE_16g690508v5 [Chlamydomonas reinhardtii]